jgi:hypothetical protein
LSAVFRIREVRLPLFSIRRARSRQVSGGADLLYFAHTQLLAAQIDAILWDPTELTHSPHPIIYHALLSPEANKGRPLPSRQSLLDEARILLGAGADTIGVSLMIASHYVLQNPHIRQRLEAELREAWPVLEEVPRYEVLEKLPYLVRPRCPGEKVAISHPPSPSFPFRNEIPLWTTCRPRSQRKASACSRAPSGTHASCLAMVP